MDAGGVVGNGAGCPYIWPCNGRSLHAYDSTPNVCGLRRCSFPGLGSALPLVEDVARAAVWPADSMRLQWRLFPRDPMSLVRVAVSPFRAWGLSHWCDFGEMEPENFGSIREILS